MGAHLDVPSVGSETAGESGELRHFIGGTWRSQQDKLLTLTDPRTGQAYGHVPAGSDALADEAVRSAAGAGYAWSSLPVEERTTALRKVAQSLRATSERVVAALMRETGKTESDALGEVTGSIDLIDWYADLAPQALAPRPNAAGLEVRKPYGVTALIVPWNYPVAIALRTLPAILAAGNTVVWKPSEKTPLSAIEITRAIERSQALPSGTVNLLLGDATAGAPLVENEGVGLVVYTGSTATGRRVAEACGRRLSPAILELGGKDAAIVDSSVDPVEAARLVALGAFDNAGQICTSMERILVHREIADAFLSGLVEHAHAWNSGLIEDDGRQAPGIGPLIDECQRSIVHMHVEQAREHGDEVLTGGFLPARAGFYYPATVIHCHSTDTPLWREETFGPVAAVMIVDDIDEAIALANTSAYGLGATVISENPDVLRRAAELDTGIVWVNDWHASLAGGTFEPSGISGLGKVGPGVSSLHAFSRVQQIRS